MLTFKNLIRSLNIFDIVMLVFLNLAVLETIAWNYGTSIIKTASDIGFANLIIALPPQETTASVVLFLHFTLVSISAVTALRFPVREIPDIPTAVFEAVNAAVMAAFINIFLLRRTDAIGENLIIAIIIASLFIICRLILPKSPFQVKIPLAGLMLTFLWLFSFLIVIRYYVTGGQFINPVQVNDFGCYKDALCFWAILISAGSIPQLIQVDKKTQRITFVFAGFIVVIALFLEFQYPHLDIGKNVACTVLRIRNLPEDLSVTFRQSMVLHATLRSFCFLFLGVVLTFVIGYLKKGDHWLKIQSEKQPDF